MLKKFKWAGVGATILILGSLAGCGGGGSGAAGTPLLGSKNTNTYNLSLSSTTLTTTSPLTVKFRAEDAYGNGIGNFEVNIAFGPDYANGLSGIAFVDPTTGKTASCGQFANATNASDGLCVLTTDSSGTASVQLVATQSPSPIVAVEVIPYLPTAGASAPTSAASAVQFEVTSPKSFNYQ